MIEYQQKENLNAIASEIEGKTLEEVKDYSTTFWKKGKQYLKNGKLFK